MDESTLETNMPDVSVLNLTPINDKFSNIGRLYILTKSATGHYIPSAVRVKTLKQVKDKIQDNDIELMVHLRKAIDGIVKASLSIQDKDGTVVKTDNKVSEAMAYLRNILFVGSKANVSIHFRSTIEGSTTTYSLLVQDKTGKEDKTITVGENQASRNTEGEFSDTFTMRDPSVIAEELLNLLVQLDVPFQINKANINSKWNVDNSLNYNDVLLKAGILTTNLNHNYPQGAYFVMNPIDDNLKEVKVDNRKTKKEPTKTENPVTKGTNTVTHTKIKIQQGTYQLTSEGQVLDATGKTVSDQVIVNRVKVKHYLDSLTKEQRKSITFKASELGIRDDNKTYYLLPGNKTVFDGTSIRELASEELNALNNAIKNRAIKNNKNTGVVKVTTADGEFTIENGVVKDSSGNIVDARTKTGKPIAGRVRIQAQIDSLSEEERQARTFKASELLNIKSDDS